MCAVARWSVQLLCSMAAASDSAVQCSAAQGEWQSAVSVSDGHSGRGRATSGAGGGGRSGASCRCTSALCLTCIRHCTMRKRWKRNSKQKKTKKTKRKTKRLQPMEPIRTAPLSLDGTRTWKDGSITRSQFILDTVKSWNIKVECRIN